MCGNVTGRQQSGLEKRRKDMRGAREVWEASSWKNVTGPAGAVFFEVKVSEKRSQVGRC